MIIQLKNHVNQYKLQYTYPYFCICIVNDEEITKKSTSFKHFDDYPDMDFLVLIVTHDGFIIVLSNETQYNELRIAIKVNVQFPIMHSYYIESKQRLVIIIKEGILKVYDPWMDMLMTRSINLMWQDVSCIDMKVDELIVFGHESGMIYSQSLKGEIKSTDMQLHNYHLQPILQVSLAITGSPKSKFIALSKDNMLTFFSTEYDRPLRVMKFYSTFYKVIYYGDNEILAFTSNHIFKLDLFYAQIFIEQTNIIKPSWIECVQRRILKNQFVRKNLQLEEQRNDKFYQYQIYKQQKIYGQNENKIVPEIYKIYMGLQNDMHIYGNVLETEFNHILQKQYNFKIAKYIYLEPLKHAIEKRKSVILKGENLHQSSKRRKTTSLSQQEHLQMLTDIEIKGKIKSLKKMNQIYKFNIQSGGLASQTSKDNDSISNLSIHPEGQSFNNKFSKTTKSNVRDKLQEIQEQPSEIIEGNNIEGESSVDTNNNLEFIKTKFSTFLTDLQKSSKSNAKRLSVIGQSQSTNQLIQPGFQVLIQNKIAPQQSPAPIQKSGNKLLGKQQPLGRFNLPQITTQEYTQELYNLKNKIQLIEGRAQTAASQHLEKFSSFNQYAQKQQQLQQYPHQPFQRMISAPDQNQSTPSLLGQTQKSLLLSPINQEKVVVMNEFNSEQNDKNDAAQKIEEDLQSLVSKDIQSLNTKASIERPLTQTSSINQNNGFAIQAKTMQQFQRAFNQNKPGTSSSLRIDYKNIQNKQINAQSKIDQGQPQQFPKRLFVNYIKDFQSTSQFSNKFSDVASRIQTGSQDQKFIDIIEVEQVDSEMDNLGPISSKLPIMRNQHIRRVYSEQKLQRQIIQPRSLALNVKADGVFNFKSFGQTNSTKGEMKNILHQSKDQFITDNYQNALNRLFGGDNNNRKQRIGISQQKAILSQGGDPLSPNSVKKTKNDDENSDDKINALDSDDSIDDNVLNEEQRSLIVEEILKADDDIVLEDNSPTRVLDDSDSESGGGSPRLKKNKSKQNKFKIVIKQTSIEKEGTKKLKDLDKGQNMRKYNIQSQNQRQKALSAATEGLTNEFLRAEKMQIAKHTNKEKNAQKYHLSKELMRDKVMITRENNGFRIIIPKTFKYGKVDLKNITNEEFAKHYSSYRLTFKDIIRMIREHEGLSQTDYLSKEQVAAFLKKNLSKMLKQDEVVNLQKDDNFNEAIRKLEQAKQRKDYRDKEKELRRLKVEEEIQKKKGQVLKGKNDKKTQKLIYEEQQRIKQQQAIFRTVQHDSSAADNSQNSERMQGQEGGGKGANGANQNANKDSKGGGGEVQMVYATELKIKERREDNKKRLENMRLEKEQERLRQERQILYNYIRDTIVKGILLRKIGHYIRDKDYQDKMKLSPSGKGDNSDKQISGSYGGLVGQIKRREIELDKHRRRRSSVRGIPAMNMLSQIVSNTNSENDSSSPTHKLDNRIDKDFKDGLFAIEETPDFEKLSKKEGRHHKNYSNGASSIAQDDLNQLSLKMMKTEQTQSKRDANSQQINIDVSSLPELEKKKSKNTIRASMTVAPSPSKLNTFGERGAPSNFDSQRSLLLPKRKINNSKDEMLSPQLRGQSSQNSNEEYDYYDEVVPENINIIKSTSKISTKNLETGNKTGKILEGEISEEEYSAGDDYGEEDNDGEQGNFLGFNLGGSPSRKQMAMKSPNRINLLNDNKINDYNLSSNKKNQQSVQKGQQNQDAGAVLDFLDSSIQSPEDSMTDEQAFERVEQEMQFQRILEKITEKMMSKKISLFKKELLIRIALNLGQMSPEDLATLEALLDRYESNDFEVKKLIIELFQEKYQIDLTADLGALIEEQMNKVIDETKSMRRKNIKELLLKKFRMLNMIARFCKVNQANERRRPEDNTMKLLADLLEDDDFYNSSDEDNGLLQEYQENVKEVLGQLFQREEQNIAKDLVQFKKNYRMKFGQQPEYALREDLETENMFGRDYQALLRISAFLVNDEKLKGIRQKWAHPYSWVKEDELFSVNMSKAKRKHLYSEINTFFEDGDLGSFYQLVAELMNRMHKVRSNIKQNEKLLGGPGVDNSEINSPVYNYDDTSPSRLFGGDGGTNRHGKSKFVKGFGTINGVSGGLNNDPLQPHTLGDEILDQRERLSQQELEERCYCALRIAEHLETNFMQYPQAAEDEFGVQKMGRIVNYLDPAVSKKAIEREMIPQIRDEKRSAMVNPHFASMAVAFRKYAERQQFVMRQLKP